MPQNFIEVLLHAVAFETLVSIIVAIILGIASLIFNKQIRKYLKLGILWLTDNEVSIGIFYTKKYDDAPRKNFDNEIFEQLVREIKSDVITKTAVNPTFIRLYSENLGMKINVRLEEESDTETLISENPVMESYNITVSMDAEIKGIRQIGKVEDFVNLAEHIHNIIRAKCFHDSDVRQSFVICDVGKIDKQRIDVVQDTKLESEITFAKENIKIKSRAPQSLRKTVKKYVYA